MSRAKSEPILSSSVSTYAAFPLRASAKTAQVSQNRAAPINWPILSVSRKFCDIQIIGCSYICSEVCSSNMHATFSAIYRRFPFETCLLFSVIHLLYTAQYTYMHTSYICYT